MGRKIEGRIPERVNFSLDKGIKERFMETCGRLKRAPNLELEKFMEGFVRDNGEEGTDKKED